MTKSMRLFALGAAAVAMGACSDTSTTGPLVAASTGPQLITSGNIGSAPGPGTVGSPITYPLYAGGGGGGTGTLVGNISVWSALVSGTTYAFHVTYNITLAGACLSGTHLQIALTTAGVPQNNGNPTPGQFSSKHTDACTTTDSYTVNFNIGTDVGVVIAAHAGVLGVGAPIFAGAQYVSGAGGNFTGNVINRRSGNVGAFSVVATPLVNATDPNGGFWTTVINADPSGNGTWLTGHGAKFVWETATPTAGDAIVGSVIEAEVVVTLPAATTGTFRITCDNGFSVDLNGSKITGLGDAADVAANLPANHVTSLSTGLVAALSSLTDLKQHNVNGDGWESVESYAVNLVSGANTFHIFGVNEYMDTDDHHTGFPGFSGVGSRPDADDPHGTPALNPAACMFGLDAAAVPGGEETAWAAPNGFTGATTGANSLGGNFTGSNWATWVAYRVK